MILRPEHNIELVANSADSCFPAQINQIEDPSHTTSATQELPGPPEWIDQFDTHMHGLVGQALEAGIPGDVLELMNYEVDCGKVITNALARVQKWGGDEVYGWSQAVQFALDGGVKEYTRRAFVRYIRKRSGNKTPHYAINAFLRARGQETGELDAYFEKAFDWAKQISTPPKKPSARSRKHWAQNEFVRVLQTPQIIAEESSPTIISEEATPRVQGSGIYLAHLLAKNTYTALFTEYLHDNTGFIAALNQSCLKDALVDFSLFPATLEPNNPQNAITLVILSPGRIIFNGVRGNLNATERLLLNTFLLLKGREVTVRDLTTFDLTTDEIKTGIKSLNVKLNRGKDPDRHGLLRVLEWCNGHAANPDISIVDIRDTFPGKSIFKNVPRRSRPYDYS